MFGKVSGIITTAGAETDKAGVQVDRENQPPEDGAPGARPLRQRGKYVKVGPRGRLQVGSF